MGDVQVTSLIHKGVLDLRQGEGALFRLRGRVVGKVAILFLEALVDGILFKLLTDSLRSVSTNRVAAKPPDASVVSTLELVLVMDFTFPDQFLYEKAR